MDETCSFRAHAQLSAMAETVVPNHYTRTAIVLHWVVAFGIACNLILVWLVGTLPDGATRALVDTHKSIGLTILGLALMRLLWRIGHKPPPLVSGLHRLERAGAHAAHWCLYALIFAMPLSGYIHDSAWRGASTHPLVLFGLIPFPRIWALQHLPPPQRDHVHDVFFAIHSTLAYALYALVALHVLGALKHQFIDRQPEIQRMWP